MQPRAQRSDLSGWIRFRRFGTQPVRLAALYTRRAFWSTQISPLLQDLDWRVKTQSRS